MPSPLRHFLAGTGLCLIANAAFADLTAEEVWADWKSYITGFGYSISGQETRTGERLEISGVRISSADENNAGDAQIDLDRIVIAEHADGTVTIGLPAIMPVEITAPNDTGGSTRISMDYRQTGLQIVASGTSDALRYAIDAETITLQSTGFEMNGQVLPSDTNSVDIALEDISGTTDMTLGSHRRYDQNMKAKTLRYTVITGDVSSNDRAEISVQTQGVTFSGQTTLPLRPVDTSDMDAMLAAGFGVTGRFAVDASGMKLALSSATQSAEAVLTTGDGTIDVEMDQGGLIYGINQADLRADMTLSQLDLPLGFGIRQTAATLNMPLRKSDTAEDFGLGLTLEGFEMDETLWSLFDPNKNLPRDAASLVVDLAGKARLLFNFLDPTNIEAMSPDAAPVEIEALDINRLKLSAVGADLTGVGAFTFDYNDLGMPEGQGMLDLTLVGGNALLDKLVESGLLPEQQAMGARMMLGLLAVPDEAPDTLRSRIEINEEGHVMANGQRIR